MITFLILLQQELLINFRNFSKILVNFLFFLISVSVFFLIAQNQEYQASTAFYLITIIWFSLLFCLIFSAADFLKKDFEDGIIEQILTACENFEVFIFVKMIASWLVNCLPIIIASLFIVKINNLEQNLSNFFVIILLASLVINFICSFCGNLAIAGNSAPILAIIALPLIIPILLISYSGLFFDNFNNSFKILFGLAILFGAIAAATGATITNGTIG